MTTYKESGVDIDAGAELVRRLMGRCPDLGGFGGLFPLGDSYLVAGADGVGTKLRLAIDSGRHDSVGIDLVAMCANDVITTGARPLFFLDYFATSKLDVDEAESVLSGVIRGCELAQCALLGGETAEMPGFYASGDYDLSGFCVGIVKKDALVDGSRVVEGDALVGLASSGLHSNGFSLVRKLLEEGKIENDDLLTPTRIYVRECLELAEAGVVKGMAHITGGGLTENVPRMLPKGLGASLDASKWTAPPVFDALAEWVPLDEMRRTFNMGIGMVLAMSFAEAEALCARCEDATVMGSVVTGEGVQWC